MKRIAMYAYLSVVITSATVHAETLSTWLDEPFAGKSSPVWTGTPGLVLQFTDIQTDVVRMTMNATALAFPQAIKTWWFNLVGIVPSVVSFTKVSGTTIASITSGIDCCKADGTGGNFDFEIGFSTDTQSRFLGGTTTIYDLSAAGLTAVSFNAKSIPANYYRSAAHIINLPNGDSTFVGGVAEPASSLLFSTVAGAIAFATFRRHRGRSPSAS
jgi:hypothetical protein